ncbi:NAD-dependent epimerase/dehydratase family protein [Halobacteriovorax sp. RT-2-6]|uniref:NAD-dependent epimerase/dehydratase family protein n=1 Tax=unclassified Halobacteriovorax TaxID=2639665 RepID=UPI00399B35ED
MTRRKMIVSGGLGFLGSEIAKNFFQEFDITIIDNLSTNVLTIDDLARICGEISYKNMDLANMSEEDKIWLNTELKDTTIFCHFAAAVGVKKIDQSPRDAIINENKINHDLLPLLAKFKTRLIFASSSEVYGNQEDCKEEQNLQIGSPDTLRWGYACNKLMTEFLIKSHEIPHIILRLFNVTGPGQSPEYGMVIPKMVRDAKRDGRIQIFGDGKQTRAFCHVKDLISAMKYLINEDRFDNQTINIGNDKNRVTIEELATQIKLTLDKSIKIEKKPFNHEYSKNSKDILKRSPNIEKLKSFYTPKVTLQEIIKDIVQGYDE